MRLILSSLILGDKMNLPFQTSASVASCIPASNLRLSSCSPARWVLVEAGPLALCTATSCETYAGSWADRWPGCCRLRPRSWYKHYASAFNTISPWYVCKRYGLHKFISIRILCGLCHWKTQPRMWWWQTPTVFKYVRLMRVGWWAVGWGCRKFEHKRE